MHFEVMAFFMLWSNPTQSSRTGTNCLYIEATVEYMEQNNWIKDEVLWSHFEDCQEKWKPRRARSFSAAAPPPLKLYCPTGGDRQLVVSKDEVKRFGGVIHDSNEVVNKFEQHCQCHDFECKWNPFRFDYYCNTVLGAFAEFRYKFILDACRIHDMCYSTGRSQINCDIEFRHNWIQLCSILESHDQAEECKDFASELSYNMVKFGGQYSICTNQDCKTAEGRARCPFVCQKCPRQRQCYRSEVLPRMFKSLI